MKKLLATTAVLMMGLPYQAGAASFNQYASSVVGFSSQWSTGPWSAAQALGAPDTFAYGDIGTAWAPGPKNGTLEYLSLDFATPVYSTGATIRETYGNGFVYQIDAIDTNSGYHTVWSGTDPSLPGTPVDFSVTWATMSFQTAGLKIYVNTNHNLDTWEEIDSVTLSGDLLAPVPEPETYAMLMAGLGLLGAMAKRRKQST
ncbi:MAG TPA: PEP-CTERM sorting domain-containing protein [Rhodocyclaceae bacterium]|nr:PEP-CTERM sorting domain-containing protein [Rhodocyclaceae bacterium]